MNRLETPRIAPGVYLAEGAIVRGNVTVGADSSIWFHAVVRAEHAPIHIGVGTNIQDGCVLHVDEGSPLTLGDHVTIGHGAILHGCRIGDDTLVGMGAIILNDAVIGKGCIIGAGALVTARTQVPDHSLVLGSPAKIIRHVTEEEIRQNHENADSYQKEALLYQK